LLCHPYQFRAVAPWSSSHPLSFIRLLLLSNPFVYAACRMLCIVTLPNPLTAKNKTIA
jgi:hypothetical protein